MLVVFHNGCALRAMIHLSTYPSTCCWFFSGSFSILFLKFFMVLCIVLYAFFCLGLRVGDLERVRANSSAFSSPLLAA